MAPLVRTGGSRHTGLAALPHRNIQSAKKLSITLTLAPHLGQNFALSTSLAPHFGHLADENFIIITSPPRLLLFKHPNFILLHIILKRNLTLIQKRLSKQSHPD